MYGQSPTGPQCCTTGREFEGPPSAATGQRERERGGLSLFTDTGGEGGELGGQLTFLHASPRHVHRPSVCLE